MQSFRLQRVSDQSLEISDLGLRMPKASGIIDPEPFRARARGEGDPLAEYHAASGGMRTIYLLRVKIRLFWGSSAPPLHS